MNLTTYLSVVGIIVAAAVAAIGIAYSISRARTGNTQTKAKRIADWKTDPIRMLRAVLYKWNPLFTKNEGRKNTAEQNANDRTASAGDIAASIHPTPVKLVFWTLMLTLSAAAAAFIYLLDYQSLVNTTTPIVAIAVSAVMTAGYVLVPAVTMEMVRSKAKSIWTKALIVVTGGVAVSILVMGSLLMAESRVHATTDSGIINAENKVTYYQTVGEADSLEAQVAEGAHKEALGARSRILTRDMYLSGVAGGVEVGAAAFDVQGVLGLIWLWRSWRANWHKRKKRRYEYRQTILENELNKEIAKACTEAGLDPQVVIAAANAAGVQTSPTGQQPAGPAQPTATPAPAAGAVPPGGQPTGPILPTPPPAPAAASKPVAPPTQGQAGQGQPTTAQSTQGAGTQATATPQLAGTQQILLGTMPTP